MINMLQELKIKDFAIIDDLTIQFNEGMTVLTGETGSGKSIIIDAINLLLGERATSDVIRFDKEKAVVEALFYYDNPQIDSLLEEMGIEVADGMLIINREIARNGRNICRINGQLVTVNQLKQLGNLLVDVHVQHDTQRLISASNYLYLLDSFADNEFFQLLENYQEILHEYNDLIHEYRTLINEHKTNQEKKDFYEFQLNELKQANLSLNEYEELFEKQKSYDNYDKLYENLSLAYQKLGENNTASNIYESATILNKLGFISTKYNEMSETLFSIYYQLDDLINILNDEIQTLDYDPVELDRINARLAIYSSFKRKYKMEIPELIDYMNGLREKIDRIENFDFLIRDYENKLQDNFKLCLKLAFDLREKRMKIARNIESSLIEHLKDLRLLNSRFEIRFNDLEISENDYLNDKIFTNQGIDIVDFYISFNLGEPVKPLSKVASGGELSRFMLGLKTILTEKQKLSTIIFDEIDTGVSGITASAIAQKIKRISNSTQVLCITHLPQVASISDHHLYISKIENNNRTNTIVKELTGEERVAEIAKMISGANVDAMTLYTARNMLKNR